MANELADLKQQVIDLRSSIDAFQDRQGAGVAAFKQAIADLQAQVDSGSGATSDDLLSIITDLKAAQADLEATPTA